MKLFQRLLVAPAALGLISPIAANATEINLNEISNYSDVESIELVNSFDSNEQNKSLLLAGGANNKRWKSFIKCPHTIYVILR